MVGKILKIYFGHFLWHVHVPTVLRHLTFDCSWHFMVLYLGKISMHVIVFLAETSIQSCFCLDHSDSGTFIVTRHTPYSLGARPLKNWKGGSGERGGVEVYTAEC